MSTQIKVAAFYKFVALDAGTVQQLRQTLCDFAQSCALRGLVLLASEGLNATVAGSDAEVDDLLQLLRGLEQFRDLEVKYSLCAKNPFSRFKVDLRSEIVTSGDPMLKPWEHQAQKLSPSEWQKVLEQERDFALIDTRNLYETKLGLFEGALDPKTQNFGEFRDYVKSLEFPKHKKVLIYCTGGIRCEKAALELARAGFEQVYQLDGGILKYLEHYPDSHFKGECFVFDHRVAVGQHLEPSSRYKLCPHCGNPAVSQIECGNCSAACVVCEVCLTQENLKACSKNCSYHLDRKNGRQAA